MEKETLEFIRKYQMIHSGDRVVIGVSGGADSVCLLHVLSCLKKTLDIELRAVHIHHGLRGAEADRDAEFCGALCRKLCVPYKAVYIQADEEAKVQGISVEEAGRLARYRILEEEVKSWDLECEGNRQMDRAESNKESAKIAVAHHSEDSAETILHNLFRGSGLKGLSGILPVREAVIRPILWADRGDIIRYLEKNVLKYMEDSTNAENDYTRNRLRNQIMPMITEEVNARAVEHILRVATMIEEANRYFEKLADEWLKTWGDKKTGSISLPINILEQEEKIVQSYVIRQALRSVCISLKDVAAGHIEELLALADKQTGKKVNLPGGLLGRREYDRLILMQEKRNPVPEDEKIELLAIVTKVFPLESPDKIPKNQYTKWFDYDKINTTLSVRFRQTGDFIMLSGGKRKTVKAFMIDEKIPAQERKKVVLLAEGSHILWIVGFRISEYYKITEHTKNVLEVRIDGGAESVR